jgi:hypothetical protein
MRLRYRQALRRWQLLSALAECAATGRYAEAGLALVEFKVIHSRADTEADLATDTHSEEVRFEAAVRKAQFDAVSGFAAPAEKVRQSSSERTNPGVPRVLRGLTARWAGAYRFAVTRIPERGRVAGVASLLKRALT